MEKENRFSGMSRVELDVLHEALCESERIIQKFIGYNTDNPYAAAVWEYKLDACKQLKSAVTDAWIERVRTDMNNERKAYFEEIREFC